MCEQTIGNNRYMPANMYKDNLKVHVREKEIGHGKLYLTRTDICFTKVRWATFLSHIDKIDRNVELLKAEQPVEYFQHIGGGYVTISKGVQCVNIWRHLLPLNSKKVRPTRNGIALRLGEWESLLSSIHELHEQVPEHYSTSLHKCYIMICQAVFQQRQSVRHMKNLQRIRLSSAVQVYHAGLYS